MTKEKERILEIKAGSTKSHSAENSLWKGLWTCMTGSIPSVFQIDFSIDCSVFISWIMNKVLEGPFWKSYFYWAMSAECVHRAAVNAPQPSSQFPSL